MMITLPEPKKRGTTSVEESLLKRRSIREFEPGPLAISEVGQILWSAYGITSKEGFHTAPSAGALFPLRVYLAADRVTGLDSGIYKYEPAIHSLDLIREGSSCKQLADATFSQEYIAEASATLIISADYEGPREKYGDQGQKFTWMDLGHLGQNVHLQAVSLDIGTVAVAAVRPGEIEKFLGLQNEEVLYLMPLGRMSY